jgi:hypothetical protein
MVRCGTAMRLPQEKSCRAVAAWRLRRIGGFQEYRFAPAATPQPVVNKLDRDVAASIGTPQSEVVRREKDQPRAVRPLGFARFS